MCMIFPNTNHHSMLLLPLFPLFSKMYLNLHFLNLVKFVVKGGRLLYFYELCHLWFQFPAQLCGGRSRFNVSYLLISWRTASVAFDAPIAFWPWPRWTLWSWLEARSRCQAPNCSGEGVDMSTGCLSVNQLFNFDLSTWLCLCGNFLGLGDKLSN